MKPKRIAIFVDHKIRDLAGLTYLKILLTERYNYDVLLAPIDYAHIISLFRPHLILMPHSRLITKKSSLLQRARLLGSFVASFPTEGFALNEDAGASLIGKFGDPRNIPDLNFIWGRGMLDIVSKYRGELVEKSHVCGNPRFDLYASPLSSLFPPKADLCKRYGMSNQNPVIFWATSFPFANRDAQSALNDMRNGHLDKFIDINELLEYTNLSQQLSIEAVLRLAAIHSNVNFIIKPHPFERLYPENIYLNNIKKSKLHNIFLVEDEPIENLLNISDILLHLGSTTSIEAWLLGKPTVSLELTERSFESPDALLNGGAVVNNYEQLAETVSYYLKSGEISASMLKAQAEFIDKWLYKSDGKSTERCVEVIHEFLNSHTNQPRFIFSLVVRYYLNRVFQIALKIMRTLSCNQLSLALA